EARFGNRLVGAFLLPLVAVFTGAAALLPREARPCTGYPTSPQQAIVRQLAHSIVNKILHHQCPPPPLRPGGTGAIGA
ncbi:MAG: hypothetical protein L0214_12855, partial [candidate division NC10 bacterium]|nr:hypothetical protein [candidate division NC10 bacterium]